MKKLVIMTILFMILGITVSAEKEDYSLMSAPLPQKEIGISCDDKATEGFGAIGDVDCAIEGCYTDEDDIYKLLLGYVEPDNLEKQNIVEYDGEYFIKTKDICFELDYSLGQSHIEQAYVRAGQICDVYNSVVSDNPEYFYIMPRMYVFYWKVTSGKMYINFCPEVGYDIPGFSGTAMSLRKIKTQYYSLLDRIEEIKESIYFEGMTDLDKLLLAHDYIIDNCSYYYTLTPDGTIYYGDGYSYTSYGILVNQRGVCQGYTYAYACVLKALGYPIENIRQVRSNELKHIWNFIKFNDNWYHVDLTWDDPLKGASGEYNMNDLSYQVTMHKWFLISDETNTVGRNNSGYYNFVLETLGVDAPEHSLATDKSYESGYIFNTTYSSGNLPANIKYKDGKYYVYTDRIYSNRENGLHFIYDSLKANEYAVTQPFVLEYNDDGQGIYITLDDIQDLVGTVYFYVFDSKSDTSIETPLNVYASYYDENGRFVSADRLYTKVSPGYYSVNFSIFEPPAGAKSFKLMFTKPDTFAPISNTPEIG